MKTFEVGDLLRFKPASRVNCALTDKPLMGTDGLVLVVEKLEKPGGRISKHFYGYACSTGEKYLWKYDQFDLVQQADQ
jgi:hypothetical protein